MVILDISRLKNSPGASDRLVKEFKMQPVMTGMEQIFFSTPVKLDVSVVNNGNSIALEGSVEAGIKLACGRCLEYFGIPVRGEISEIYYNEAKQDIKDEAGEDWIPFRGGSLDITAEVVGAILSSIPMKLLCREDCMGLCQSCGKNLNVEKCNCSKDEIDIRLVELKQLLEKNSN